MTFEELAALVRVSIVGPTSEAIEQYCGRWYSPYYNLMFLLSTSMTPCVAVELGTEKGRGLFSLAQVPSTAVVGIDNAVQQEAWALHNAYDNVHVIEASSLPVPAAVRELEISILHIDTTHTYSYAKAEFEAYESYLVDGAVVLFDDLHAAEDDVLRFFNELPHEKLQEDRLHPVCGYGVVLYGR